jgi:hypothetical protein
VTTKRQPDEKFEREVIGVLNRIYVGQARVPFHRQSQQHVQTILQKNV